MPSSELSARPRGAQASEGTELDAALLEIRRQAAGRAARKLWLPPLERHPTVDGLASRYASVRKADRPWELDPIVGELDDPANQAKRLLAMPLTREGNAVVFGPPGSGVEDVVMGTLYSLISEHGPSDLACYLLGLSSGVWAAYREAPQVGNVFLSSEEEGILRAFDFIESELKRRRKLLAPYGGSFARYRSGHDGLPSMVLMVDSLAALSELFPQCEQRIVPILREGPALGVYSILMAASTSALKYRMRPMIGQMMTVGFTDEDEYRMVFGSLHGLKPPKGKGRGVVEIDDSLYIFQGAFLTEEGGSAVGFAKAAARKAAEGAAGHARGVPVMPEHVTMGMLEGGSDDLRLAYGIRADSLLPARFDFSESPIQRAVFARSREGVGFLTGLLAFARSQEGWEPALIDAGKVFRRLPGICAHETQDSEEGAKMLAEALAASGKGGLLVVTGISGLLSVMGISRSAPIRRALQALREGAGPRILLYDSLAAVAYSQEPWFKAHLSQKDGLWVGAGADSQSSIGIVYSSTDKVDPTVKGCWGYEIAGGHPKLVHLLEMAERGQSVHNDAKEASVG